MAEKIWVNGRELLDVWGLGEARLFECLRKGLPAYTRSGKTLVDAHSLGVIWEYLSVDEVEKRYPAPAEITADCDYNESECRNRLEEYYRQLRKKIGKVPRHPRGSYAVPFTLPEDEDEANQIIEQAMEWRFYIAGVLWFIAEHPEENLPPLRIPGWDQMEAQKYRGNGTFVADDARFHEFLKKAGAEAVKLYSCVTRGLKEAKPEDDETTLWMVEAKTQFAKHLKEWVLIKEEYTDDGEVFRTIPGPQNKRDFVGKILAKTLIDHGYGFFDYQDIYKKYNAIKKRKITQ